MPTIEDLLKTLQNPELVNTFSATLKNTKETWKRIRNKDAFSELRLSNSEKDQFLKEWISENPYSAIS